jgi:chromosome segregation ATPase
MATMTVEQIRENIENVQAESRAAMKSFEQSVDDYLDTILEIGEQIDIVRKETDNLTECIYSYFSEMTVDEYKQIEAPLKKLNEMLGKLYIKLRTCKAIYSGAKTNMREFHYSIDNLKEVSSDLALYKVELDRNERYKKLLSRMETL